MPYFRKKPVRVEAIRYDENGINWADVCRFMDVDERDILAVDELPPFLDVLTEHGWTELHHGEWLVKNLTGRKDVWPVSADIFAATYEPSPTPSQGEPT